MRAHHYALIATLGLISAIAACGRTTTELGNQNFASKAASNLHWVGVANIKYSSEQARRNYSSQIVSLMVANRPEGARLYYEVGEATFADRNSRRYHLINGLPRSGGDARSTDVGAMLNGKEIRFTIGNFYFVGALKAGINSPLSGVIYERGGNIFAGYFEFSPRHDGADSFGFSVNPEHMPCLEYAQRGALPPAQCFGPGAP